MNTALEAAGSKLRLDLGRAIGAVGEHLRRRVALVQEPIQLLAVMDRRIGHLVAPDQLVLGIRIHVVLVPEKTLAVLLRPAHVAILLAQFGRLVVPRLRIRPAFTASFSSPLLRFLGSGALVVSPISPPRLM